MSDKITISRAKFEQIIKLSKFISELDDKEIIKIALKSIIEILEEEKKLEK